MRGQRRGNVGFDPRHVRREAQCAVERVLERGGIGDDGELADMLLPGRELEASVARVAANDHVVHRRRRVGGKRIPDLEPAQQRERAGVERVGANVDCGGGRRRRAQRDRQTEAGQRQRQAAADDAGPDHLHVEAAHAAIVGSGLGDNRRSPTSRERRRLVQGQAP
jgi:hypothetical protein